MLNLKIPICLLLYDNLVIGSLQVVPAGQVDTEEESHSILFFGVWGESIFAKPSGRRSLRGDHKPSLALRGDLGVGFLPYQKETSRSTYMTSTFFATTAVLITFNNSFFPSSRKSYVQACSSGYRCAIQNFFSHLH